MKNGSDIRTGSEVRTGGGNSMLLDPKSKSEGVDLFSRGEELKELLSFSFMTPLFAFRQRRYSFTNVRGKE